MNLYKSSITIDNFPQLYTYKNIPNLKKNLID